MSDKQIIANGIDVSGCEKQGKTIAGITCGNGERIRLANEIITKHKLCKDNPNCRYKQLKRKEKECENLQHKVNALSQTLAEINEIAEKVYNDCDDCYRDVDTNCDVDCIDCTLGGKAKLAEQILQKLAKVRRTMKYRKKPVEIEAIQWTGNNETEIAEFTRNGNRYIEFENDVCRIETLEGIMTASKGDFIIKGVRGEFYPCKPDIFAQTYDKVEND